ncbi:MAG: HupE/UreJ family protein [Acidobacteria bacterium]|nr:HupE/UreJ family protein [Acidobacteriota bacterium]
MFSTYLSLGFEHILPRGFDHVLFISALVLASPSWRPLVWQVSAFTMAHALTLALAVTGVVQMPSAVVEPLIALSIVAVAVENIVEPHFRWRRPAMAFGFGLLHGLGLAGALVSLGLPSEDLLVSLLAFNLGVEGGQLVVVAALLAALAWCRSAAWYRARAVVPASAAIAAAGAFWCVQRVFLT